MKEQIYTQPDLPYANDALNAVISEETVNFHYWKHEKAYISNLNKLIEGSPYADMELEDIIRKADGALFNNASQAWNHIFYFFSFSPYGGGEPKGELKRAIEKTFGSFEQFKSDFVEAGSKLFGSGWVWLSADSDGQLFIQAMQNAGNPLRNGLRPILTFDVWEHAYYLDYQNRRADHLQKLWDIIDWEVVSSRY